MNEASMNEQHPLPYSVHLILILNPLLRNVVKWSDTLLKSSSFAARFLKSVRPFYDITK